MIFLAQVVSLVVETSNYQPRIPVAQQGTLQVVPNGQGFDIRLDGGNFFYPRHFLIDSDVPIRAAYNFGGDDFFFSPTGITDDEAQAGVFPVGLNPLELPVLYLKEPGTVVGRIEIESDVPVSFTVFQ